MGGAHPTWACNLEPRTVFFLASELGPTGAARQLGLLAAGLPADRFRAEVGVLGPADTPVADAIRAAGVPVHSLPLRHVLDFCGMRNLRRAVAAANPAVLHAWGPAAVRASRLLTTRRPDSGNTPPLVVSAAPFPGGGVVGWLAVRRLRQADRAIPMTWAEGERYRRLGVDSGRLTRIGPCVAPVSTTPDRAVVLREIGLPPTARLIATAGRLEPNGGLKAAIWAFDMLRYEFPDLFLVIFGEGPDRTGLEAFGRALAFDDFRVRFPGCRADLPALLALAEVVWVTDDRGGVNLALEAMAAGRPVVGWKTPELAEVVEDGTTGFLVNPGERPQISAKTYSLLEDPAHPAKVGQAGRQRAAEHFAVGRMVEQYIRMYGDLTG